MINFTVYCGSRPGSKPAYERAARLLGETMAAHSVGLIYGGATVGLMGTVARAVQRGGSRVVGVMPNVLTDREITNNDATEMIHVDSMHERKQMMFERGDAFIALPGGPGTMEEWFEMWTCAKIGQHTRPIALLNIDGFYDPLLQFLQTMEREGFVSPTEREMIIVETDPVQLVQRLMIGGIVHDSLTTSS